MDPTMHAPSAKVSKPASPSESDQPGLAKKDSSRALSAEVESAYQLIAANPQYKHFVNIPARIISCLDYFDVSGNQQEISTRLLSYYLFIAVVDDAIDLGHLGDGRVILEELEQASDFDAVDSPLRLVTEVLKQHIEPTSRTLILAKFRQLHQYVLAERCARSIGEYIESRKAVGRLTAELSFLLIRDQISGPCEEFCRFMMQVGEVGCLIDSLIDIRHDRQLSLVGFQPTLMDYAQLMFSPLPVGANLVFRHPGLSTLFLQAVADNILDRFRRGRGDPKTLPRTDRKEQAPGVA